MTNTKPVIAVPIGDPAGVGPEIVAKALALPKVNDAANVIVIGDKKVMERAIGIVGADLTINVVEKAADGDYRPGIMNLISPYSSTALYRLCAARLLLNISRRALRSA